MAVDGTFYSQTVGEKKPDTEMPLMPLHDDNLDSKLQVCVSNYAVDSLLETLVSEGVLSTWVQFSQLPPDFPFTLTTSGLNTFFPGFVDKYGPNIPVDIKFEVIQAYDFHSTEKDSNLHILCGAEMTFHVIYPNGTSEVVIDLKARDIDTDITL